MGALNEKQKDQLVKMADETERENRILNIEIIEVRGQLEKLHGPQLGTVAGYDPDQMPLWPELPNGEGVADA